MDELARDRIAGDMGAGDGSAGDGSAGDGSAGDVGARDSVASGQSGAPGFGAGRPTFGMIKDQGRRLEIAFALKNGGMLTAIEELGEDLTEENVRAFSEQLAKDVAGGATRTFSDSWNTSGQRAWINLGEVVAFSVRPAK